MRIAVLSLGSRGDVQPQAALAVALAPRGHEVRLISHGEYAELVAGRGVEYRALSGDTRAESWGIPWVQVCLQPIWRTRAFPSPMAPPLPFRLPGALNRLHHDMVTQLMWQPFRALVNESRRAVA